MEIVDDVFPIEKNDVLRAGEIAEHREMFSARDSLYLAITGGMGSDPFSALMRISTAGWVEADSLDLTGQLSPGRLQLSTTVTSIEIRLFSMRKPTASAASRMRSLMGWLGCGSTFEMAKTKS